ncbi:hypothetical protein GE09DRAFT_967838 [Coniochaeta sp. 2T2.1]|nr:hypothetical protein GE09DRAFT_967838 [Coniochaeta sp. 2T2.1]
MESPETKRRKIRKGTRSCWECKRRKIRCNFGSASDAVCIGCQRRGTHCLSQEYPEEASRPAERGQQIGDRIVRVEALVEQLVRKVGNGEEQPITSYPGLPTPPTSDTEPAAFKSFCDATPVRLSPSLPPKLQQLSRQLYAALPSAEVTRYICESAGGFSIYFHQMMTRSKPDFDLQTATPKQSAEMPSPDAHPIMIAKFMLNLAEYLQYIPHTPGLIDRLGEAPRVLMKRLADAAITVTTNEELMGTVESLECIILEGAYQANSGNLRRSWLAFRRAIVVGQLMGIHRSRIPNVKKLDANTKADPKFMWYRIQFADRYLCLMLGLPAGSLDNSFANEAAMVDEPPVNRLERRMTVIASRILERNEGGGENCSLAVTQSIDLDLQKAAKLMPSKWWLPPNLSQQAQTEDQEAIFWETLRLINQMFYYNLLNQLHLPYMLMFSSEPHTVYSKLACVNASREVLSRFIAFRTWNKVAFCCRSVDFFALMAAMTLVLAHLHANDTPDLNCLAHQRHSDRAMMEQVLESMEMVYKLNMDVLSEKSGDLLRRLLEIEADAAEGRKYDTQNADESGTLHAVVNAAEDEPGVLRMCIPYFGVIRIAREGGISREPPASAAAISGPQQVLGIIGVGDGNSTPSSSMPAVNNSNVSEMPCDTEYCPLDQQGVMNMTKYGHSPHEQQQQQQQQQQPEQQQQQQYPYPGLAASADDWAFQGVDMAFFDNLMKGLDQNQNVNNGSVQQSVQADSGGGLGFGGSGW